MATLAAGLQEGSEEGFWVQPDGGRRVRAWKIHSGKYFFHTFLSFSLTLSQLANPYITSFHNVNRWTQCSWPTSMAQKRERRRRRTDRPCRFGRCEGNDDKVDEVDQLDGSEIPPIRWRPTTASWRRMGSSLPWLWSTPPAMETLSTTRTAGTQSLSTLRISLMTSSRPRLGSPGLRLVKKSKKVKILF